jgi:flagellar P-ring protein precursor FlgI
MRVHGPFRIALSTLFLVVSAFVAVAGTFAADNNLRQTRIRDISSVEGVRDNPLAGYGLVVGLNGTGDRQQTMFPVQTLGNLLLKMGVRITSPQSITVKNIAAVMVTANLPPFARPGTHVDVNVSSVGDARSLEGGFLVLATLRGPDGQVYATAQGPIVLGGFSSGGQGNSVTLNHPTAGRVPNGGMVEKDAAVDLGHLSELSLLLHEPDYLTAREVADAINKALGRDQAKAVDGRRIMIKTVSQSAEGTTLLLSRIENLAITVYAPARVIMNERSGTVVMGHQVTLSACSVMHGNLAVQITTEYEVSQPNALSQGGQTVVVPRTTVSAQEGPAKHIELPAGATVQDLISGLQSIGATARDIIAIIEAINAAGALNAELEVI